MINNQIKIAVIGLGSMGKRRIRLLQKLRPNCSICGIDQKLERRENAENSFKITTYETLAQCLKEFEPEMAFVSASPLAHYAITRECAESGIHVFSEINLLNENHDNLLKISKRHGRTLFLSSTPKYRKEMQFVTERIRELRAPITYSYHVGQYLPDWHPWEKFSDFFVSDKRTNGCREVFAIELPWIIDAFGEIREFHVTKQNISSLKIDFPDTYSVCFKHENGNVGNIIFDVVASPAVREMRIIGDGFRLDWNGTPETMYISENGTEMKNVKLYDAIDRDENYNTRIIENIYEEEIKNFFDVVSGKAEPKHTFEKDIKVLELIDRIEA